MKYFNYQFEAVLNNGTDVDMSKICGCTNNTMSWCEANCKKYYDCHNIALANDILKKYEEAEDLKRNEDKHTLFLKIISEIDTAITQGLLVRDINNYNNILVYRMAGDDTPEGWYSENILKVALELVHDKDNYELFKKAVLRINKDEKETD